MVRENTLRSIASSPLQEKRRGYAPPLPSILRELKKLVVKPLVDKTSKDEGQEELRSLFPYSNPFREVRFHLEEDAEYSPLKVGIVFSGGPAPGGHNVISGLYDALVELNPASLLVGILDGPSGIIKNHSMELTKDIVDSYRNLGGFDCIGSGRTKIETQDQFEAAAKTLAQQHLDGLVIVGGDDSNTNAAFLAEYCQQKGISTRIVGVPKTIDGDLKNASIEISFGFDTASKVYSEIIGNLLIDARSQKKYYFFVKMMGRSASHLTLECALKTHVNLALIGEEIAARKDTLTNIVGQIADLICVRSGAKKNYGVILIPEGLLEFIPECQTLIQELNRLMLGVTQQHGLQQRLNAVKTQLSPASLACFDQFPEEIQAQLLLDRDPHGNVQLSKIETERLIMALVEKELDQRKSQGIYIGQFNPQPLFCGYEGRSGFPTNFDCTYCYALGHVAALLIQHGLTGYLCSFHRTIQPVEQWEPMGVPIVKMLDFEMRKNKKQAVFKKALVDLKGVPFTRYKEQRERWGIEDSYCCPGPIQFEGASDLTDDRPLTLLLEQTK